MSSSRHDIGCTEDRAKRASPFIRDFVSKYWTTYTVRSVRRRRRRQVSICSCWRSKRLCWLFPGCFEIFEFAPLRRPSHTTPQVRPSLSWFSMTKLKSNESRQQSREKIKKPEPICPWHGHTWVNRVLSLSRGGPTPRQFMGRLTGKFFARLMSTN